MDLAIEGQKIFRAGQYDAGQSKFQEAEETAKSSDVKHVFQSYFVRKSADDKLAETYFKQGMVAAKNGEFASARAYFDNAYKRCTSDNSNKATFAANKDAMSMVTEAMNLFNLDKFEEGKDKLKAAMTKFIDTKKEFTAQVESKTAKILENAIKRRNELVTKQINGLWSGFFEAEKAGDESKANQLLSEVESTLQKSANYESLGSEYQKLKQMYDLHKKGYQLYEHAIALRDANLELRDLDKLNEALDGSGKSEAVFEEAVKIDQRFEHELEVVQKSHKQLSRKIDDIEKDLAKENDKNDEKEGASVYVASP
jgi:hypothetical protein